MPEQDNDRLEQFFRKAASKPDIPFSEGDWSKLEDRLNAHGSIATGIGKWKKAMTAIAVAVILLFTSGLLVWNHYNITSSDQSINQGDKSDVENESPLPATSDITEEEPGKKLQGLHDREESSADLNPPNEESTAHSNRIKEFPGQAGGSDDRTNSLSTLEWIPENQRDQGTGKRDGHSDEPAIVKGTVTDPKKTSYPPVVNIEDEKIFRDLIQTAPALAVRNRQKATVKLPGAEEAETGEAESVVPEAQASDKKVHPTTPRLSLLLSFAPDFSSTSINRYTAPGKAFGAMIQYHLKNRWTVSAGVIKNNKQYTGGGEDYSPPAGYWKYYTNGKIPISIDGACDVLEFPIMVQYTILESERNKLLVGVGTSSYLMLNESYQYFFDEPNPGAREGWTSKSSSRFLLNMVNFTVGYEHKVLPGFMIGIEPYLKIPVEEIGWSNLKLFSTGASLTMRYIILRKKSPSILNRTRGPD